MSWSWPRPTDPSCWIALLLRPGRLEIQILCLRRTRSGRRAVWDVHASRLVAAGALDDGAQRLIDDPWFLRMMVRPTAFGRRDRGFGARFGVLRARTRERRRSHCDGT